jgi:hypothetical protein
MELEPNSLDWNWNELEHGLELEDMKRTYILKCLALVWARLQDNFHGILFTAVTVVIR